jgi:hypothetical protein
MASEYPIKGTMNIKTFIETNPEEIDREINEFRKTTKVAYIQTHALMDDRSTIHLIYIVFYLTNQ